MYDLASLGAPLSRPAWETIPLSGTTKARSFRHRTSTLKTALWPCEMFSADAWTSDAFVDVVRPAPREMVRYPREWRQFRHAIGNDISPVWQVVEIYPRQGLMTPTLSIQGGQDERERFLG